MSSSSELLKSEKFWKILNYLNNLSEKTSLIKVQDDLEITQSELYLYISFLKDVGMPLDILQRGEEKYLEVFNLKKEIEVKFSIVEWLSFQATFPKLSELENQEYFSAIKNKLLMLEDNNKSHDLYPALETLTSKMEEFKPHAVISDGAMKNEIITFIEEAIIDKELININLKNKKVMKLFPRKVVFLDNELTLVAEGVDDKCLFNISLNEIHSIYEDDQDWKPLFSAIEIDDFIASIRAITENEIRLVLKVYEREKFNTDLKHHHFGNQCMFTNPEGDYIWAATIEPNDEILNWLSELGQDVEVLDPISIKRDLLKYCEDKLKKIA
jgi:predicted DNA-binding transcriptional regulator YafY